MAPLPIGGRRKRSPRIEFVAKERPITPFPVRRPAPFYLRKFGHCSSVSSSTLATETAFSSPTRTTLRRIDHSRLDQVDIFLPAGVKTFIALSAQHSRYDYAAVYRGILGDLAEGASSARLRFARPSSRHLRIWPLPPPPRSYNAAAPVRRPARSLRRRRPWWR